MVAGAHCWPDSRRSRAREIMRSGVKERGQRGDSISPLNHGEEAPWWRESRREEVAAHCSGAAALLFVGRRWLRRGGMQGGGHGCRGKGAAAGGRHACKDSGWWR
jgi:hypothetical protein